MYGVVEWSPQGLWRNSCKRFAKYVPCHLQVAQQTVYAIFVVEHFSLIPVSSRCQTPTNSRHTVNLWVSCWSGVSNLLLATLYFWHSCEHVFESQSDIKIQCAVLFLSLHLDRPCLPLGCRLQKLFKLYRGWSMQHWSSRVWLQPRQNLGGFSIFWTTEGCSN